MLYRLLFIGLCLVYTACAFPTGVGSCDANPLQTPHTTTFLGSLESYRNTQLKIGGVALSTSSPFRVKAGKTFPIEISSTEDFAGFLIRISKPGVDTKTYLGKGNSTNVQVATICTSQGLGGLCHKNKTDKISVKGTIRMPSVGSGFTLHVTIVRNKKRAYQSVYAVDAV